MSNCYKQRKGENVARENERDSEIGRELSATKRKR